MKKINLFITVIILITCMTSNMHASNCSSAMAGALGKRFVASPCTLVVTGNLHTRHSGCTTGLGSCIKVRIILPKLPIPILVPKDIDIFDDAGGKGRVKGSAIINLDPKNLDQAIVDFINLTDEQMKEEFWELESDFVIDGADLSEETDGYKSITLLKGNYEIDRSENKIGRCIVRCKVN